MWKPVYQLQPHWNHIPEVQLIDGHTLKEPWYKNTNVNHNLTKAETGIIITFGLYKHLDIIGI